MSTPAEQIVPAEFQGEFNLPPSGGSPLDQRRGAANLAAAKNQVSHTQAAVRVYETRLKHPASKAEKARYQSLLAAERKRLAAVQGRQNEAQGRFYEASGQFDKLLSGSNRDAFAALQSLFNSYGLGSLAGKIYDYVKQGYGADTVGLLLQDTTEYKERFAGNEARRKAGLPVLAPAEYLATESAYRQILSNAGLPKGFYDSPADFRQWIAGDVSPTEIKSRVDEAADKLYDADPYKRTALRQLYGVDDAGIVAYFLDPKKAEPLLKKQAAAAGIGAAALQHGLSVDRTAMESYATMGISEQQAQEGYGLIQDTLNPLRSIASRYGETYTQGEAERDVFSPGGAATQKRKRLASQERAAFSGRQGSSAQGLNAGYRQT